MNETIVGQLQAAQDMTTRAGLIADSLIARLPAATADLARQITILHDCPLPLFRWLSGTRGRADDVTATADAAFRAVGSLSFAEHAPYGLTFNPATRRGLITLYADRSPDLLTEGARMAAEYYGNIGEPSLHDAAEHFYCLAVSGQYDSAASLRDALLDAAARSAYWGYVAAILAYQDEAEAIPFVLPFAKSAWHSTLRGLVLTEAGRPEAALAFFRDAAERDPSYTPALLARGKALTALGQEENAIASYSRAIERSTGPLQAQALLNRAYLRARRGEAREALADLDRAQAANADPVIVHINRGAIHARLNDHEAALRDFDAAVLADPANAIAHANRGLANEHLGNDGLALDDYERAIALDPSFPQGYNDRGYIRLKRGDYEAALADFTSALSIDPAFGRAYFNRGWCHVRSGAYAEALADYTAAIATGSDDSELYEQRALVYERLGRDSEALADISIALERNPVSATAWLSKGAVEMKMREPEQALLAFNAAIRADPLLAAAYVNRAVATVDLLSRPGSPDSTRSASEALADFERAISLQSTAADEASAARAHASYLAELPDEAIRWYSVAIEKEPRQSWLYYNRAAIEQEVGHLGEAIEDYTQALGLGGPDASALVNRGIASYCEGQATAALSDFVEASKLAPNNPEPCINEAVVHYYREAWTEARRAVLGALRRKRSAAEAYVVQAAILLATRENEAGFRRAEASIRRALRFNPVCADALATQGLILSLLKRYDEALIALTSALQLNSRLTVALATRSAVYHALGNPQAADADRSQARLLDSAIDFDGPGYVALSFLRFPPIWPDSPATVLLLMEPAPAQLPPQTRE
jgi:tetratricopeptide (TPR) repeat protein